MGSTQAMKDLKPVIAQNVQNVIEVKELKDLTEVKERKEVREVKEETEVTEETGIETEIDSHDLLLEMINVLHVENLAMYPKIVLRIWSAMNAVAEGILLENATGENVQDHLDLLQKEEAQVYHPVSVLEKNQMDPIV